MALTKLVCTIGPASKNPKVIRSLAKSGMSAARINTAFGGPKEWTEFVHAIREATSALIIFDLKGPDTRIITNRERSIAAHERIEAGFSEKGGLGTYFNRDIAGQMKTGDTLVVNAGLVKFKVVGKSKKSAVLEALESGFLKNGGSVHSLSREFDLPPVSEQDRRAIAVAKKEGERVFALSMARSEKDIALLRGLAPESVIIAKVESRSGVANIDGIIESSDIVMVARGDLGIEMPLEKVPFVQKSIIEKCRRAGKASIVATQMLESMVYSTVPTRAEVSDIANAIIDGTDALMLSGETANGKYPELAARTIMRIAEEAEKSYTPSAPISMGAQAGNYSEIICGCARDIANSTGVTKILTPTRSGFTPRMISRFRVKKPIYALTEDRAVAKRLDFHFGVTPIVVGREPRKLEDCIFEAKKRGIISKDDILAVTLGQFSDKPATNTVYYVDLKHSEFARGFKTGGNGGA